MEMCLGNQQYITLLFYLNDICVFSSMVDEMLDCVGLVLNHLKEFNLKIKPKKMYFFPAKCSLLRACSIKEWNFSKSGESVQS